MYFVIQIGNLRHAEGDLCLESFLDALRCERRTVMLLETAVHHLTGGEFVRDENGGCCSASLLDGLFYGCEYRLAQMLRPCLLRVRAADDICAWIGESTGLLRTGRCCGAYHIRSPAGRGNFGSSALLVSRINCVFLTHVPCFPVKPWNSTLVSPLMRRFLIVSE